MTRILTIIILVAFAFVSPLYAQNYDESKAYEYYPLPEVLRFANGKKVKNKKQWAERRKEILNIFQEEMYGIMPGAPDTVLLETIEQGRTMAKYATRR